MCPQWGEHGGYHGLKKEDITLDLQTIESILDQAERYSPSIQLLGGEPMLHPDFDKILDSLSRRRLSGTIETNGTLLEEWAARIMDSSISAINLSIDGRREVHDTIRGPGTFDRAMAGMQKIFDLKNSSGCNRPDITLRMTICEENFDKILETAEFFREMPIALFVVQHFVYAQEEILEKNAEVLKKISPDYRYYGCVGPTMPLRIDGQIVCEQLQEICRPNRFPFPIKPNPPYAQDYIKDYYKDPSSLPDPGSLCPMPMEVLAVECRGDIYSCSHFLLGKMGEAPLDEIWNGEEAVSVRKEFIEKGIANRCITDNPCIFQNRI